METTPRRRKRETDHQAYSKSPSIEHVLNTIFQRQKDRLSFTKKIVSKDDWSNE